MLRTRVVALLATTCLFAAPAVAGDGEHSSEYAKYKAMPPGEMLALAIACNESCGETCGGPTCEEAHVAGEMLSKRLTNDLDTWEKFAPALHAAFAARKTEDAVRRRMIDVIAWVPNEQAAEAAGRLFEERAKCFDNNQLLAFAEKGSEVFGDALTDRAKKRALEETDIGPAAWLARKGDDRGKKILVRATRVKELGPETLPNALVAAKALEDLGEEGTFAEMRERAHGSMLAALDAGRIDDARYMACQVSFLNEQVLSGRQSSLSYLGQRCGWYASERGEKLASADQVFEFIEHINP